jgi:hypothetical protein
MMELNTAEKEFIEIKRAFSFLFEEGYHGKDFSIGGREPGIILHNWVKNRIINIFWSEGGFLDITISRKKVFAFHKNTASFSIRDFYKYFNCGCLIYNPPIGTYNQLKHNVEFIQRYLMPVIRGEMWIDELIKQKMK